MFPSMLPVAARLLVPLLGLLLGATAAPVREHLIAVDQTVVDGAALGVQPGDVILVAAGVRPYLKLEHVVGTAANLVIVRNHGGQVVLGRTDRYYGLHVGASRHLRITGTGSAEHRYGFHLTGTNAGGSAVMVGDLSSDCELDHLHIERAGFAGIMAKTDGAVGTFLDNLAIHDNYIHDVGGEGLYLGETKYPGQTLRDIRVWNNVIARTGYEACQIANASGAVRVHHNIFYRAGLRQELWQDRSFQLTAESPCEFTSNIVIGAHSCLVITSGGAPKIFRGNYFAGTVTEAAVVCGDAPDGAVVTVLFADNFFRDVAAVEPVLLYTGKSTVLQARNNRWDGANRFIRFQPILDLSHQVRLEANRREPVPPPRFVDEARDDFRLETDDPYRALGLGLIEP